MDRKVDAVLRRIPIQEYDCVISDLVELEDITKAKTALYQIIKSALEKEKNKLQPVYYEGDEWNEGRDKGENQGIDKSISVVAKLMGAGE